MKYKYDTDCFWMKQAIYLAKIASHFGEVPVGAVLVRNNTLISTGLNSSIHENDPSAHAEMIAIRRGCEILNNYRVGSDFTLYVTLEPCIMCFGLLVHSRVRKIVFGAISTNTVYSKLISNLVELYNIHRILIKNSILKNECSALLKSYFNLKRKK